MKVKANLVQNKMLNVFSAFLIGIAISLSPISHAPTLAACKPVKPKGTPVGTVNVGTSKMPIVPFSYPAGGVMEPQKTTEALFMSLRHMPLSSSMGTSVLAWHINANGCWSDLNFLIGDEKVGSRFRITDETGVTKTYRITDISVVKKGKYKKSWFTLVGPRKLALFTCSGAFVDGHYVNNKVIIAVPA